MFKNPFNNIVESLNLKLNSAAFRMATYAVITILISILIIFITDASAYYVVSVLFCTFIFFIILDLFIKNLDNINVYLERKISITLLNKASLFASVLLFLAIGIGVVSFVFIKNFTTYHLIMLALGSFAAFVTLITFITNYKTTTYRYYSDLETDILNQEHNYSDIINSVRSKNYTEVYSDNSDKLEKFELVAQMAIKLCSDIFYETVWKVSLYHKFIHHFERSRRQYWDWLHDHRMLYDPKFISFMRGAQWRDLLPANEADHLRWVYEVDTYDKYVLSPLHDIVKNKLIKKIIQAITDLESDDKSFVMADIGCGRGKLINELLTVGRLNLNITKFIGIDYSPNMVNAAKDYLKEYDNVTIYNRDMCELDEFKEHFDIVFSINSLLPRDPNRMKQMLKGIISVIKPNGLFISILPSFDTVLDLKKLDEDKLYNEYIGKDYNEGIARKYAQRENDKFYEKSVTVQTPTHSIIFD